MKQAFAILFALTLVFGQPLAASTAHIAPSACCHCGGTKQCCVRDAAQSSRETPALPAPVSTQNNLQTVLWLTVSLIAPIPAQHCRDAAADFTAATPTAVPLFTRDCAYLL